METQKHDEADRCGPDAGTPEECGGLARVTMSRARMILLFCHRFHGGL